jgi:hypothetical protein
MIEISVVQRVQHIMIFIQNNNLERINIYCISNKTHIKLNEKFIYIRN